MADIARRLRLTEPPPPDPAPAHWAVAAVRRRWLPKRRWMVSIGAAMGLIAVATAIMVGGDGPLPSRANAGSVVTVTPRPLVQHLTLVGTIEPGGVVNVIAPFDGAIKEKLVEFGTRVNRGQALLVLDTTEVELLLRDAEAVAIKAERAVEELRTWAATPEVLRARNGVVAAQMKVEEDGRKEKETKALLSRGIIPRVEYDAVVNQLRGQELQLVSAKQELDAALKRGDAEHSRLAVLELETARRRLAELKQRMDSGLVEAPVAGLLLRPAASSDPKGGSAPAEIEIGSRAGKGQPLFTIADTETLKVVANVDEIDVNCLREGQVVAISGDAFGSAPLAGRIARISAQAVPASAASSRNASFEVVAALSPLSDDLRRRVRVGMSATLAIVTYENATALVVPAAAIIAGDLGPVALVRDAASGQDRAVPVVVGRSTEEGLEVAGGLKAGDLVVVPPPY